MTTRAYIRHRRIHHGAIGVLCIVVGAVLVWTDRHDYPWTPKRVHVLEVAR